MKYLVLAGHVGNNLGAVSTFEPDAGALARTVEAQVNLQQLNGFAAALAADHTPAPVSIAVPAALHWAPLGISARTITVYAEPFSLSERVRLANAGDYALIELHNNAAVLEARGAEAICYSTVSAGHAIATAIVEKLCADGTIRNRGVKTLAELGRELYVIRRTRLPAVIVESGFLTNAADADVLDVDLDGYNERVGALIYAGLKRYHVGTD